MSNKYGVSKHYVFYFTKCLNFSGNEIVLLITLTDLQVVIFSYQFGVIL